MGTKEISSRSHSSALVLKICNDTLKNICKELKEKLTLEASIMFSLTLYNLNGIANPEAPVAFLISSVAKEDSCICELMIMLKL